MPKVILTITAEDEQLTRVSVSGPIGQKAVCYALLECARDAIKDHIDKANSPIDTNLDMKRLIEFSRKPD